MERIVRSATQGPAQPRERRRSRANRKSLRRTLKNGLTPEEALALGLLQMDKWDLPAACRHFRGNTVTIIQIDISVRRLPSPHFTELYSTSHRPLFLPAANVA
ncbi:hypothetical protein JOQ06_016620 [Pogonophryne albipinna]|uniref:DAD domain-containing protein n=1 Tax=Pogonophryne albipinna TaxID=1090488 RepID=A0AAD6B2J0_9TELE|nr:hypothetical protein JOQ06_016620 [Pogonophryne albipinna]